MTLITIYTSAFRPSHGPPMASITLPFFVVLESLRHEPVQVHQAALDQRDGQRVRSRVIPHRSLDHQLFVGHLGEAQGRHGSLSLPFTPV